MGLLDRVKQNQPVPPGGSRGNAPAATATLPRASTYTPQAAIPVAQPAATAPPAPAAGSRSAAAGDLPPPFTAAQVLIPAQPIREFRAQTVSPHQARRRQHTLHPAEGTFRS